MFGVQKHDHQAQNINYSSKHVKPQTTNRVNQNYSIIIACKTQGTAVHYSREDDGYGYSKKIERMKHKRSTAERES